MTLLTLRKRITAGMLAAGLAGGAAAAQAQTSTAVGTGALVNGQNTVGNTAVGFDALFTDAAGGYNTAVGIETLTFNTAAGNSAVGAGALFNNTNGQTNTALGANTLSNNTSGSNNTAVGASAMQGTAGDGNAAFGYRALEQDSGGAGNTAVGTESLGNDMSGSYNVALGWEAGSAYNGAESNNIVIGNGGTLGDQGAIRIGTRGVHTHTFIAGISGAASAGGLEVFVNRKGELGTLVSSARFKEQVTNMGEASADLMNLRPVTFYYRPGVDDGSRLLQYGLVAEEVAKINPGLVQFDDDGRPLAVRYHFVNAMLLNEVQAQHARIADQQARLAAQAARLAGQEARIERQQALIEQLGARLARLEAAGADQR